MEKFITLGAGDLKYLLPALPARSEILFSHEKKENQYWRRQKDFPKIFFDYNWNTKLWQENTRYGRNGKLIALNYPDSQLLLDFRDRELQRRKEGIWFMNNGEPVYLTGGHYFILQWGAMADVHDEDGNPYGQFRWFQAEVAYFMDLCKKDRECLGGYIIKPKKTGLTQFVALDFLDEATRYRDKRFGIMSKVLRPDCVETNMKYFMYGYDRLPWILKPRIGQNTQTLIEFNPPKKKGTGTEASNDALADQLRGLNSQVFCAATKANGFDGPKMFRAWYDEFPKYEAPNGPEAVFSKGSEVVKEQRQINGKIWITSYPPEDDTAEFEQAKKIYYDSKISTRDPITKRTKTELYTHYISVVGSEQGTFNKYGESNKQETKTAMDARRMQLSDDPVKLQNHIRQYSETEDEAWRSGGGGGTPFDNVRLGLRQEKIKADQVGGYRAYTEGNLRWKNGIRMGEVEFIPLTIEEVLKKKEGKFRVYGLEKLNPRHFNRPYRDNIRDKHGKLLVPATDTPYVAAADPTEYVLASDVAAGSKNAITAFHLPDLGWNTSMGQDVTDRFILELLMRHQDPDDLLEDLVMLIHWLGCYIIVEGNKKWLVTRLVKLGLQHFILMRNKDKTIERYDPSKEQTYPEVVRAGGIDVTEELVRDTNIFFKRPQTETDIDQMEKLDSERMIEQFMGFKTLDTKRFDLGMCAMWNIQARNAIMAIRSRPQPKDSRFNKTDLQRLMETLAAA